jgi:signal transduction histidine kinase
MSLHYRTMTSLFFSSRWILLFMGLLIYLKEDSIPPELLLMAVLFQTIYSLLYVNQPTVRVAILAISMDLGFVIFLLWSTGGLSSPFLVYGLSGLWMVKKYVNWKTYYSLSLCYIISLPIVFALESIPVPMDIYLLAHLDYGIYVFAFYCTVAFLHYSLYNMTMQFRKLVTIYSSRHIPVQSMQQKTIQYLEELLQKVLDQRDVLICISTPGQYEKVQSWNHMYFTNYLKQNPPHNRRSYGTLPSLTGERVPLYIQTLYDHNNNKVGWLLVKVGKNELSVLHKIYIQLILMKFQAYAFINEERRQAEENAVAVERDMIAQNLHDGIAQELFFISIQLFQLKNVLTPEARQEALPYLTGIEKKVKESHRDIRQFIIQLKDEKRKFNLHNAIEKLLNRVTEHTEVKPLFENVGWIPYEHLEIEETIYRLVEEAAYNVIKHAKAKHIHVKIEVTSVQWTITIKDDGVGMKNMEIHSEGKFGMSGMENRIKALNGSISFQSGYSEGTTITAFIPRERSVNYV